MTFADGKQVTGHKRCRNMEWEANGVVFKVNTLVLPLSEYDLVLGMKWFEPLGVITWDFTRRVLQFEYENHQVQLHALPKPKVRWMTNEQLLSAIGEEKTKKKGTNIS